MSQNAISSPPDAGEAFAPTVPGRVHGPIQDVVANPQHFPYREFTKRFDATMRSPVREARREFLASYYNPHVAPRLTLEEAALQMASMKLGQMYLREGDPLELHIQRDVAGRVVDDYAQRYTLHSSLIDSAGLVAYRFEPQAARGRGVILFAGTSSLVYRDKVKTSLGHPTCFHADLHPLGLGHGTFANNRETLVSWAQESLRANGHITVTGHSLGGVYAVSLRAALPPSQHAQVRVFTSLAPGVESAVAAAARGPEGIRQLRKRDSRINLLGEGHPAAEVILSDDMFGCQRLGLSSHSVPHLGLRQLQGEEPPVTHIEEPVTVNPFFWGEWARAQAGRLAHRSP